MNDFIKWESLEFKKDSGKEKIRCPSCDSKRSDKKDRSLQVNHSGGYAKCHYCQALSFKDDKEKQEENNNYKLPSQTWRNYTKLSDKMVKWLEDVRCIKQSTAIDLGWTEEKYYQPQLGKEVVNLVFNSFDGSVLVNKKYRSADKKFTQSSGTKSIFYNINSIIGEKEIYITEGEFDCAALHQIGIKNVISMPQGANDNDSYWEISKSYFKDVRSVIIAVDNDTKGNELKEKIAQRIGRYRCKFIEFKGKDANDDLISGNLHESIKNLKRFPVGDTFTAKDIRKGVDNLYDNGLPDTIYPKGEWFGNMKKIFSVMRGQVVLPTGIPSHGKSTFTDWYVLNLLKDYNMKASWYTPEHSPMPLYETELIQKTLGRNFWKDKNGYPRLTKKEIDTYDEWADEKIYLTDCGENDTPTWTWLLDKFKEQMYSFGIDIFVIDAFNKVIMPQGNKLENINNILTKLTTFARVHNVIIFLVAHPTKMQKNKDTGAYDLPTLYDVSGSSDFRNQVHCGYTIYRYFDEDPRTSFTNLKTKYSFQGEIGGVCEFDFCEVNGRLLSRDYPNPCFNLLASKDNIEHKIKGIMPKEAFDMPEREELPF